MIRALPSLACTCSGPTFTSFTSNHHHHPPNAGPILHVITTPHNGTSPSIYPGEHSKISPIHSPAGDPEPRQTDPHPRQQSGPLPLKLMSFTRHVES
ncbi:hypothetical protein SLE2022_365220 [Rubroshorea leprosula]